MSEAAPCAVSALRQAKAVLSEAVARLDAIKARRRDLDEKATAHQRELADIESTRDAEILKFVMEGADAPDHSAQINRVQCEIAAFERANEILAGEAATASAFVSKAEANVKQAAQAWLNAHAIDPARDELYAAFEALRNAATKLMGATQLATNRFATTEFYGRSYYGPAASLLGDLQRIDWDALPYSIEPDWLKGQLFRPHTFPGVADAQEAVLAALEIASAPC